MSVELLTELKKLQYKRSNDSPFASQVEFHTWVDKVLPLLSFDQKLYNRFKHITLATTSARALKVEGQEVENINSAIGILNQAVAALEAPQYLPASPPEKTGAPNLEPPQKVTIKWLYEHVPVTLFFGGFMLLASAFACGIAFAETQLYALIKNTISSTMPIVTNPSTNKTENKPSTASQILPSSTK